jgi:monoamine oxidase
MGSPDDFDVDYAVVGAGLSGLSAARELHRRGASVAVLEARERVGGKMHTVSVGGCAVDLGAHWVGPTQRRMLVLTDELGIAREKQHLDGTHLLTLGGERHEFTGSTPIVSVGGTAETALRVAWVELRRRLVDNEQPWRSRGAGRLDSFTLAHWMRGLRSQTARATFKIAARTVFGAEPSELSFLYFLWYAQCAGGIQALMDFEGGAQDSHLTGGTQQVCERIAAELGDAVALGSPVSSIEHGPDGVLVASAGRSIRATKLIVAVSPALAARIDFEPALPPAREALAQRMPLGAYMKGVAVYDRAWWRDRGLSGLAVADRGPVQMVVDAGPRGGEPGVLIAFITGAPALEMTRLSGDARRAAVLEAIAGAVAPEAASPATYRDFNWTEERWSRGAPVGLMGPGTLSRLGPALREPAGPVHWCGTDTATEWNGYMEGAVQAGERAAREIAA